MDLSKYSGSGDVPVFNCVIYVSKSDDGGIHARVANLAEFECAAASEREAIMKLVPAFKERVRVLTQSGSEIPWIEPPSPKEPAEQERFVPVHL
ncbi:MAG: hypothetical protein CMJ64_16435 [Planctomycetaceae bacterium]|nr:hypothetical protein [Planctomycetaceae bacterium]